MDNVTTIQNNLALARQHLRQINQDICNINKSDLLVVIPSIYEEARGTYQYIDGKKRYVPVKQRKILFHKIELTLHYNELTTKKAELEKWIYQTESELARLSSQNFPRVAL